MERRMRPRVTPIKKALAFLNDSQYPAKVIDYSATGLKVVMITNGLQSGTPVSVDLVIDESLCACSMPGTVCWTKGSSAGIRLEPRTEHQIVNNQRLECSMVCL